MILERSIHERTLDKLVKRLTKKYPTQRLLRDMEYRKDYGTGVLGQIDLLRIDIRTGAHIMYEVKTGNAKISHAKDQYRRFKSYFPQHNIKGVYVHPKRVQRL